MSLLPSNPPRELRDYQSEAIERLRDALRSGKRRPILQAPTGYGKTVLASHVLKLAREKGNRVCFCVPAIDLIDQTLESFWQDGLGDIGVIQSDHVETDWSRPVQIASVQTLARRTYPDAQLVIIDEVHRWFEFYGKWLANPEWQKVPFIGLSATPWTRGLGKHFDSLIISATTQELIDQGYLSPFRVFAPSHPDLTGVKIVAGDYHEGQLSEAMNKSPLVADVVETWLRRGEGRPTLCFGVDRAHAKALQQRFEAAGIPAGYQDAYTPKDERAEIRRKFHHGDYAVVCNVGTLTTGVDWDVRCIILARPTRSEILYVQIIGRGLRTANGKKDCLILDHSDTTIRLGFVTDIVHEQLDEGKERQPKKTSAPLPKECPECAYLMPPRVMVCPNCGHVRRAPISGIENADGELVELTKNGGTLKNSDREIELRGVRIPLTEFYAGLIAYGLDRGYRSGWAKHKFKTAVGRWPDGLNVRPIPPRYELLSWIRAQNLRYAKARNRDG
jgi:superfamily II DNA or RNA helicase